MLCLQVRFRFLRLVGIDASLSNAKLLFLNYLISLSNAVVFLFHDFFDNIEKESVKSENPIS